MRSENLSNENFSAANSSKYGLYFSSVSDVHLLLNATGYMCVVSFPFGEIVVCFCDNMPAKPYLQPSVVTIKGVPSNFGPFRTGSLVKATFSPKKAFSCSSFHRSASECPFMAHQYAALPFPFVDLWLGQ
jgi:hypothetical protein